MRKYYPPFITILTLVVAALACNLGTPAATPEAAVERAPAAQPTVAQAEAPAAAAPTETPPAATDAPTPTESQPMPTPVPFLPAGLAPLTS
ncbi:hypothetical protein D6833_07310, partial [Candidatus Parcubacteria bacterium]